uniref:Integrase catalytic domain-containing protein n=1 Tax=Fagus sylvatica TaxID=28930 RepID=A0A2N9IMP1_FAGSY
MPPKTRQRRNQREVSVHTEHSHAESAVNVQGQDQPQPPASDPNREAPPTNLLLELIQNLQQNQSELAEAIKQLKENDAGTKILPQNEGGNQEKPHQDSGSHEKETAFVTMTNVANLLKQEKEKNPKEPRLFVRKPPYPTELLKQPYPEKYVAPTFSRFDGRKGSALVHISKFIDSMGAYAGNGDLCLREFSKSFEEPPPPVPCTLEEMMAILNKWVADGIVKLPEISKKATEEDKKNPKFCYFHQYVHHSTADCWTLRRKFHEKIQDGTLELPQKLAQQLLRPFMAIAADSGAHCFTAETHASRAFLETTNAITFTDEDMEVQYPDHRRSLYLSATINEIQGAPMEIKGFGGVGEYTKGHIQLVLKVGPIVALTRFHVVDSVARLNGKPIRIAANSTPFDQSESHFVEAALYDEITPAGEASLAKPIGIPLPKWEEIKDAPEADLRDLLERKKKRKVEASASKSQPQCPSCLTVNATDTPESADTAETVTADPKISAKEELEVINLSSDPNVHRPVSISASLSVEERMHLVELLKEYQDVFAWQYDEMPGIDPKLVAHSLNVEPGTRPVVQPMRTFHPEVEAQITQEVKKLLSAGFIKPIQHPRWLSNIVPVKKKNGQIRDAEKTAFRTPIGNFYYTVMPFGLKNAGATYQRTMTAMFHDMMHREIEDYVDDIVVKSKTREDHFGYLKEVHQRGIDVDPARASAIATMKPPTTHKELKSFLGKLSYIRRFIPGLAAELQAIGALIAQENDNGVEQPIYYVSRTLKDAESRYSGAERSCLALIYASQRTPTLLSSSQDEVPGEINEVFLAGLADSVWTLKFDGSSTATSAGAGIVLYKDDGEAVTKSFKFDFPCSNNAAEYEAYLAGLAIAYEMGIKHLRVIGDSNLVPSKVKKWNVTICKKIEPITESLKKEFEELSSDQEDWQAPIKAKLMSPVVAADLREIKDYTLISGDLYRRLPGGVLARCISIEEAKERLPEVHEKTCGDGGAISLYRRLQRLGYFWPNMSAEAAEIQSQCPTCQFHYSNEEVCATFVSTDWRTPFLEYLLEGILPSNPKDVYRLKRLALRYFVEGGTLFRKGFHGEPLRCLSLSESQMVMKETHAGECGEHQGKKRLYQCLLTLVANFIREHIITRFGIPYKLVTDNGTPFINKDVREVLEHYQVKHRRSTPYYPQGNGQAEATNRMLLRILSKMVFDYGNDWKAHLADVLWAYRSSPKTATVVLSPRVMQGSELEVDANICAEARTADLEGLDVARRFG